MHGFIGELLGTFFLVFFGTSSVAVAVVSGAYSGLFQVAVIWGVGVTLAIYATRHLSCAHLNPAVTLAMVASGRMKSSKLPVYFAAQFIGAMLAACLVLVLFGPSISAMEAAAGIVRGEPASVKSAMMFGEYFPNPGVSGIVAGKGLAFLAEAVSTMILVTLIFLLTEGCNLGKPSDESAPVLIGATVALLICLFAPLTQCGMNPARDFGPRLVSYLAGWGSVAIPGPGGGAFLVYVLGPLAGGLAAAALFKFVLEKAMHRVSKENDASCGCDN